MGAPAGDRVEDRAGGNRRRDIDRQRIGLGQITSGGEEQDAAVHRLPEVSRALALDERPKAEGGGLEIADQIDIQVGLDRLV